MTQKTHQRMAQNWDGTRTEGLKILARQDGPLARTANGFLDGLQDNDPVSTRVDYENGWLLGAEIAEGR